MAKCPYGSFDCNDFSIFGDNDDRCIQCLHEEVVRLRKHLIQLRMKKRESEVN